MVERVTQREGRQRTKTSFIDCDIHNIVPSVDVLEPYLPARWRKHVKTFGMRQHHGFASGIPYPKASPGGGSRVDAWPPSGLPPGADLDFMREQHLDVQDIEYGILNCLYPKVGELLNDELGAALARATNDWQIAEWLDKEPRLRASIVVPTQNPEMAAEEIDRLGDNPGFVQVLLLVRTEMPLGKRHYWPIYEAAERHGLVIGIHAGGSPGNPITPVGWPSHYLEDYVSLAQAFQTQLVSLVSEGIFAKFPGLRVALIEGGFTWLPSLMWRFDKNWKGLRGEVPWVDRLPSEIIHEHVRLTIQPVDEPPNQEYLLQTMEQLGSEEMLLFSTDYPHWHFDEREDALPVDLPPELERKILVENARALYGI